MDDVLIAMERYKEDVHEDEQLEAKETNFDEDLGSIENWLAKPKNV